MWRHAGVTMGAVLLLGAPVICAAQHRHKQMPPSEGASVAAPGFSSERLSRIDSAFARALDRREIEGAVILVLRDGQTAYERAFGWADREEGRQMRTNAIFRIASQTKAITSVAVMSLVEEGRIALTDPVSRFIPEFARTTVLQHASSGYAVVVAQRPITIHDLLTHTAGISYGTDSGLAQFYRAKGLGPAAGYGWYTGDKDEPICETMERLASLPFAAQPGARFVYGYNTDILGCVVERASGMSLADFIDQRITGPLKMRDTHFFVLPADHERLATVYGTSDGDSVVRAADGPRGQGSYVDGPRMSYSGGAGLTSTAADYARFLEMMRNGGVLDGVRILSPATVALMTTNQTDTLYSHSGVGFGLGFSVILRPGADGRVESVGTFGWSGAYGTTYEVDPRQRLVIVYMTQLLPNRSTIAAELPMLVYQALLDYKQ